MISIRPGFSASLVRDYLAQAISDADAVSIAASDTFVASVHIAYNQWVSRQVRTLGSSVSTRDMESLVMTPRYWSLQTVDPGAYGFPLREVISLEMQERLRAIEDAKADLQHAMSQWHGGDWAMAVLDTNVLLLHHAELGTFDWHSHFEVRPDVPMTVWIPIAVVDELDSLKRSNGVMYRNRKKLETRTLARQALRDLNVLFPKPGDAPRFEDVTTVPRRQVELRLLLDEPGQARAEKVDTEVIDRAAGLQAFSKSVAVFTYDVGMAFSARSQGVEAVLLEEDVPEDDDELGPFRAKSRKA